MLYRSPTQTDVPCAFHLYSKSLQMDINDVMAAPRAIREPRSQARG
jgi:hypothetical protein